MFSRALSLGIVSGAMIAWIMALESRQAAAQPVIQSGAVNASGPLADFANIKNIKAVAISPDGKSIACTVAVSDIEANKVIAHLWLMPYSKGEPNRVNLEIDSVDQVLWSHK